MKFFHKAYHHQSRASNGFTLLELMVVMALLSVVMVGLTTALRNVAQTQTKIDQRVQRMNEVRGARAFLHQILSRVSASKRQLANSPGKLVTSFEATSESLAWIGILPARPDIGGRHFFKLLAEDVDGQSALVIKFTPYDGTTDWPDWSRAQTRVMIQGVSQLHVQAMGLVPDTYSQAISWPVGWQDGWPIADELPEQIKIAVTVPLTPWPEWVIAIHPFPQSDSAQNDITVGGGAK